mmetsp:Transcript_55620/g.143277  ORF Transcript_55620/g.143277 Transcript_55620/m.143277 type:complete len:135 (+) Transcript_55620:1549-1953(+)
MRTYTGVHWYADDAGSAGNGAFEAMPERIEAGSLALWTGASAGSGSPRNFRMRAERWPGVLLGRDGGLTSPSAARRCEQLLLLRGVGRGTAATMRLKVLGEALISPTACTFASAPRLGCTRASPKAGLRRRRPS